jgi:hypothetical protein
MQFLKPEQRVKLTVTKMRASGSTDKRKLTVGFALVLDAEVVRGLPKNIQDEYRGMKSAGTGVSVVEFDSTVDSQNIEFYRLPKEREKDFRMEDVDLGSLALERTDAKDVILSFRVQHSMTKASWDWIWYALTREVFAEFEECQQELDIKEAKGPAN